MTCRRRPTTPDPTTTPVVVLPDGTIVVPLAELAAELDRLTERPHP